MLQKVNEQAQLRDRVQVHLDLIYRDNPLDADLEDLAQDLVDIMRLDPGTEPPESYVNHWDQRDAIVITYGDSIVAEGERPLQTLKRFLDETLKGCITGVHILPF